jgi:hypothetical protein
MLNKIVMTFLAMLVFFSAANACRFTVREIGFADFGVDEYKLYFFKDANSTDEQIESFTKISFAAFLDANVSSEIIDVNQTGQEGIEFYKNSDPEMQKLALVSPANDALELLIDRTSANFREEVWTLLEQVLSSETRENILQNIVKNYAVVLLVNGVDETANQAAMHMATGAIDEIKLMMASMPKPVDTPPQIIVVQDKDIDSEKVLLWSLGLDAVKESLPAITILYGRGRQMGRLLPAGVVKANIVRNLLAFVGADCECGLDRSWILGRMMPTRWESEKQQEVIKYHKFDAENPLIKSEMSQIISISPNKARSESKSGLSTDGIYSYTENEIELINTTNTEKTNTSTTLSSSPLKTSMLIIASALLMLIATGAILFFKAQKKEEK